MNDTSQKVEEVAQEIARELNETDENAVKQITHLTELMGTEQARHWMLMALQAQEHDGVLTSDKSRKRTVGGTFFQFVYTHGKTLNGKNVKRPPFNPPQDAEKPAPFNWNDRIALIKTEFNANNKGVVMSENMFISGRPGKIVDRGEFIVTIMASGHKAPVLPKGLPKPSETVTNYAVYISKKHWNKVKDALGDPTDKLIIEGYPKTDKEVSAIAIFATSVKSLNQQKQKKVEKQQ